MASQASFAKFRMFDCLLNFASLVRVATETLNLKAKASANSGHKVIECFKRVEIQIRNQKAKLGKFPALVSSFLQLLALASRSPHAQPCCPPAQNIVRALNFPCSFAKFLVSSQVLCVPH